MFVKSQTMLEFAHYRESGIMVCMQNTTVSWLAEELEGRGWSIRELARRAKISHTTVSQVLSHQREPTWEFCAQIAQALDVLPETVFRKAGLLPPVSEAKRQEFEDVAHTLAQVPDGPIREEALEAIRAIVDSARRRSLQETD